VSCLSLAPASSGGRPLLPTGAEIAVELARGIWPEAVHPGFVRGLKLIRITTGKSLSRPGQVAYPRITASAGGAFAVLQRSSWRNRVRSSRFGSDGLCETGSFRSRRHGMTPRLEYRLSGHRGPISRALAGREVRG